MNEDSGLRLSIAKKSEVVSAELVILGLIVASTIIGVAIYAATEAWTPSSQLETVESIQTNGSYVAVMFWSKTCPVCESIKPYWVELEENPPDNVKLIDIEYIPGVTDRLFRRYGVSATPTFLVLAPDGKVIARLEGAPPGDPVTYLRYWITRAVEGYAPSETSYISRLMSSLGLLAYPFIGVALAFSPCVAPILAILVAISKASLREAATCSASAALGLGILAALVASAAALAVSLVSWLREVLAVATILLGSYFIFDPNPLVSARTLTGKRAGFACLPFGLLAAQCSLPLIAALILAGGATGSAVAAVYRVLLAALGLGVALLLVLYLASKASSLAEKLISGHRIAGVASGILLIIVGLYILLEGVI